EVEHGLLQADAPAAAAAVAGLAGDVAAADRAGAADRRQQVGARLDPALARDVALGLGDRQLAVSGAGHFIGLQQVLGLCGSRQREGEGENEGEAAKHGSSLWFPFGPGARPGGGGYRWNSAAGSAPAR